MISAAEQAKRRSTRSLCVLENDAQRITRAAVDAAHSMFHIHAVVATRAAHRSITRRKNNCLALIGVNHFGFGLSARLLLDQQELPAIPIAALLAQEKDHLQRE